MTRTSYVFLEEIRPRTIFVDSITRKQVSWNSLNWYNKLKLINCFLILKNKEEISSLSLKDYIFYDIYYDPLNLQILSLKFRKITS